LIEAFMHDSSGRVLLVLLVFALAGNPPARGATPAKTPDHAIVAGFERFHAGDSADSIKGGRLLLSELFCTRCHRPEPAQEKLLIIRQGPILGKVGQRVRPSYLRKFLSDPQAAKPGTTMPRLFNELPEQERAAHVEALVHLLASTGAIKQEKADPSLIRAGKERYHKVGCVVCHGTRDDRGNPLQEFAATVPLGDLAAKYTVGSLRRFLEAPLISHAAGRMPALLQSHEAKDVANYLLQSGSNVDDFVVDPAQVKLGRELFAGAGCANCHQLQEKGKAVASRLTAPPLGKLHATGGCLERVTAGKAAQFALDQRQRAALVAALKTPLPAAPPPPAEQIGQVMTALNCYACHERAKVGGVEPVLNPFFKTAQQEMGEEGRLPPSLDGVGAKLRPDYLKRLLDQGGHDRPYMFTRMPGFGAVNTSSLPAAFAALDKAETVSRVTFTELPARVKAQARHLVSGFALGCVKCHTFAGVRAEGVQGIDMTLMTQRLNHDWFRRYVAAPQKFRPGTRMPAAWVDGQSPLPQTLGGTADSQIEAIWLYLSDGGGAQRPPGIGPAYIPLVPEKSAIVYRNFIQGAGPRGIAVGYPEKVSLAFDANDLRLALLWQGAFFDAARHWSNRSEGFEGPLGDNILRLPSGPEFAVLDRDDQPWPTKSGRELGYHFRGYRLTPDDRPTFLYAIESVKIEDYSNPVAAKTGPGLRRTLTLTAASPPGNLWFRAAAANKIERLGDGRYRIKDEWTLRLEGFAMPHLRQKNGKTELLVPVQFQGDHARIVQEFVW
jgi:mono/diheme cytochrome c family protein